MAVFSVLLSLAAPALMLLLLLLIIAFLGYCLYIKYIHMKYDHIPGPPRDSFFFGQSPTLVKMMENGGNVHDKFLEWAKKYGPVYRLNLLHYVAVFTHCPQTTKEILMSPKYPKEKHAYKKIFNLFGQRFFGNGLVTARDHEQWYKQRRIMDPAFSSLYLRGLMGTFNERAEKLMDKLAEVAESKTEANMLHLVNCVTLDVLSKVAFGVDLDLLNNSSPFPKAIETCLRGMVYYVRDMFFEVLLHCLLIRSMSVMNFDLLTSLCQKLIADMPRTHPGDILMLDRASKEVDDVIGLKRDISCGNLGELVYLLQVLKETLRIYPTAPGTSHDVAEDMVIDGIHIPGEFSAVFSSYVCGRLDKFFKDPLKFDPDRFHPDAPKKNFAQMEAKVVLAKLLQRFDFTLVLSPGQTFDILDVGMLKPESGVVCTLSHRDYKD
uniref:Cytochrome P450, family 46, subfamily A, polypeptide 1, tandem duplicate 4 n=1 Tax=Amphilophus citrinellus TaxID=61819 RepID=A0A3Q0RCI9_AMPCI